MPLEYRVKAAYLFNFAKFVEWPQTAAAGPLTICVAGRNVFGEVLSDTVRGETINGRPLAVRVILEPEPGCHIIFVPRGAAVPAYLRAARSSPTLTVGESPDFIAQGGIVNFTLDGAQRAVRNRCGRPRSVSGLRISSRLLRLARGSGRPVRRFRDLPIRHKLLLTTFASSAAALALASGGFLAWDVVQFRAEIADDVDAQGRIVAENSAAPLTFRDNQAAGETLAVLWLRPRIDMACLYAAANGQLFADLPPRWHERLSAPSRRAPSQFGWETLAGVSAGPHGAGPPRDACTSGAT